MPDPYDVNRQKKLTVIVGPTASGKTDLGIALATARKGVVISADSRQVYAEFNAGTAKPKESWLARPHHPNVADRVSGIDHYLLNIRPPNEPLSLAEWQAAAKETIAKSPSPLLVGGTMLYVDSIVFDYNIPAVEENATLRNELAEQPTEKLWQTLVKKDPAVKIFINPGNRRRIIRALEVITITGEMFSAQRQQRTPPFEVEMIGLFPGWDMMQERLELRHREMLETDLIPETKKIVEHYGQDLPLLATMNYRQALQLIDSKLNFAEALADTLRVNLRYARRQMSWWRRPVYAKQISISWFRSSEEALEQLLTQ